MPPIESDYRIDPLDATLEKTDHHEDPMVGINYDENVVKKDTENKLMFRLKQKHSRIEGMVMHFRCKKWKETSEGRESRSRRCYLTLDGCRHP